MNIHQILNRSIVFISPGLFRTRIANQIEQLAEILPVTLEPHHIDSHRFLACIGRHGYGSHAVFGLEVGFGKSSGGGGRHVKKSYIPIFAKDHDQCQSSEWKSVSQPEICKYAVPQIAG